MSDGDLIGWAILLIGFVVGYGVGHGRGQISGIRWATKQLDEQP